MKALITGLLGFTLVGYASAQPRTGFDAYIGRPVSDLAMRIGAPTATSSDAEGWRVFEWSRFGPSRQRIGAASVMEGLMLHRWRCRLLVESRPARRNPTPAAADWIIEDWRFTGPGCV